LNKNIGSFLAFNRLWFAKNQRFLLWLLNAPIIKIWFRWILRIRKDDCPIDVEITDIEPNNFSYGDRLFFEKGEWKLERTTNFRTHPKYGKRIYHAFKPLWWLIHFWDWVLADRFIPQWSYGFTTLTAYPDADPETTTVDGIVRRSGVDEPFATIIVGAGTSFDDTTTPTVAASLSSSASGNQYATLNRGIFLFDTSSIGSSPTISAVTLSLFGSSKANPFGGTPSLDIVSSNPASNTGLANADFSTFGSTSFGNVTYASFDGTDTIYTSITLNASGISNIAKTGISKFGSRIDWDRSGTFGGSWVVTSTLRFNIHYADEAGTTQDPKLVVTYSSSTAWTKTLTESATISNVLTKTPGRTLIQSITMTANLIKLPTKVLKEFPVISDSLIKTPTKVYLQTSTVSDSLIKTIGRTLTESVIISDILTAIRVVYITLTDSFTASDFIGRAIGKLFSENPSVTANLIKADSRQLSESATVTDTALKTPGKTLAESISFSDTLIRTINKLLPESLTITDTKIISRMYGRIFTEAITVTDLLRKTLTRVLLETLIITDVIRKLINGLLALFSDKYTTRNSLYSNKYLTRNSAYNDKYTTRGSSYSDKYTSL
jgi:hypothetical protein